MNKSKLQGFFKALLDIAFPEREKVPNIIVISILLLFVLVGINNFNMFPQAKVLVGNDPFNLLLSGHPHGPRFLIAYPAVIVSRIFDISIDKAFSFYATFLFIVFLNNIISIIRQLGKSTKNYFEWIVGFALTVVLMQLMNGRLIFAFAGMAIILKSLTDAFSENKTFNFKLMINLLVGFALTVVSSGTMMIGIMQIFFGLLVFRKNISRVIAFFVAFILLIGPYLLFMIGRNLDYFGGGWQGFLRMLNHGLGRVFYNAELLQLALLITCVIFVGYVYIKVLRLYIQEKVYLPLYISVPISLFGGLFGLSTALMITPTLVVISVAALKVVKNKITKESLRQDS